MKKLGVLLVDDHELARQGLRRMLDLENDIEVVGEVDNAEEVMAKAELLRPDVILMDIKMPNVNGLQAVRHIKEKGLACPVIMLTLYDEFVVQALEAGARGYLLKDIKHGELTYAIRRVCRGQLVVDDNILSRFQISEMLQAPQGGKAEGSATKGTIPGTRIFIAGETKAEIVISSSVDAHGLLRFIRNLSEVSGINISQTTGSYQKGTVISVSWSKQMPLLESIRNIPEVEAAEEVLNPQANTDKRIFVTLRSPLTLQRSDIPQSSEVAHPVPLGRSLRRRKGAVAGRIPRKAKKSPLTPQRSEVAHSRVLGRSLRRRKGVVAELTPRKAKKSPLTSQRSEMAHPKPLGRSLRRPRKAVVGLTSRKAKRSPL